MKFIQRLKNDKTYKRKVILLIIIFILIIGFNEHKEKKMATVASCENKNLRGCGEADEHNALNGLCLGTWLSTLMDVTISSAFNGAEQNRCWESNCVVAVWEGGISHDAHCFKKAPNRWIVKKKSDCDSGEGSIVGEYIICREAEEGEACTEEIEKTLAGFLDSMWALNPLTCKQRFYLMGGIGAMLIINMI